MSTSYSDEIVSFNAIPIDSPIHLLDFGLMTEVIQGKVVIARRKWRKQQKDELVNKLTLRFLKECLYSLSDLGIINLYKKKKLVSSKKNIIKYLDDNFIPLIYFKEALQKQDRGFPMLRVGDRVRCLKQTTSRWGESSIISGNKYGIISSIISRKSFQVDFVRVRVDDIRGELYPDFSQLFYGSEYGGGPGAIISGWDLEKIGQETISSTKLRNRLEECEEKRIMKVNDLWNKYIEPELQWVIVRDRITEPLQSFKNIWFCGHRMNVLDKQLWETIHEPNNKINIRSRIFGCGYTMKEVTILKYIIDRINLVNDI